MIRGIDVAYYEPRIDWKKVREADYRFVFVKASQANWTDKKFVEHWGNARKDGMFRGAYHFYDPRWSGISPQIQAEYFWKLIENDPGELPMVVDIEAYASGHYFGSDYWYQYLERLKQLSGGKEMMVYTAYFYWVENVRKYKAVLDQNYFKQYPLWIAGYGVTSPKVPLWDTWTFWQYADHNFVPGVTDDLGRPTACDEDYFNGDWELFQQRFNLKDAPPIPEPPPSIPPITGGTMYKGTVKTSGKLWSDFVGGKQAGSINVGDIVEGDAPLGGSVHLTRPLGYTKLEWLKDYNLVPTSVPPPPPPTPSKKIVKAVVTFDDNSTQELFPQ